MTHPTELATFILFYVCVSLQRPVEGAGYHKAGIIDSCDPSERDGGN